MAKSKTKAKKAKASAKPRRIWRTLLISVLGLVVLLLLFVSAFIFNPFEGSLPELRDIVPRGVNFFVRKKALADDFVAFPEPKFWASLQDTSGFGKVDSGPLGTSLRQQGLERALGQAEQAVAQVKRDSGGWVDVLGDMVGEELIFAGYNQDHSTYPPRPLPAPQWCLYTRVSWRIKAAHGLAGFGFVQSRMQEQGLAVSEQDDLLVVTPSGQQPIYIKRHLDVIMVANAVELLTEAQLLLDNRTEEAEPIGLQPAYTDGAVALIDNWAEKNDIDEPNVLEFLAEPNAFDGFRRFASSWPNPQNRDSMNERVLASFLNLKGWRQVTGGLIFDGQSLVATGQVGLNSKQHTAFQSKIYTAEQQRRSQWLDPFLKMVPDTACAAAALRMPVGDFLHAMIDALEQDERELINDGMRRSSFRGDQLSDVRDLVDRMEVAFQPRTGFVFRKNTVDNSRDKSGKLMVPVAAKSPMPQVAWVFWLRPGGQAVVSDLVAMLGNYYTSFGFRNVWELAVPYQGGKLSEKVTEFTNPQIPATGEIAMIVFGDFFVVSNSGPLIRDLLRTRYSSRTGVPSIRQRQEFDLIENELSETPSGFIWIDGENLVPVIDDYLAAANSDSASPDPDWMMINRPDSEDYVRRTKYPRYPSKASMPRSLSEPGGEFDQAVVLHLQQKWTKARTNFSAADRTSMEQLRGMAQMLNVAAIQVELQNNFIRLQARILTNMR